LPGPGLLGGPDEVAEVNTAHGQLDHHRHRLRGPERGGADQSASRDPAPDSTFGNAGRWKHLAVDRRAHPVDLGRYSVRQSVRACS
jgi:hypothetical protein